MTADIHRLTDKDELAQAHRIFRIAMVGLPSMGPIDHALIDALIEPGRAFGALIDGAIAGATNSYSGAIAVPGGEWLPHAAVTHVGVLPSHTRRGVATRLLARQLRDLRDRGEAIATLRASDARIYERFGYGIATTAVTFTVDKTRSILRKGVDIREGVRFIEPADAWPVLARISENTPAERAGIITRSRYWWNFQELRARKSSDPAYVAVVGDPGRETGFVRYHPIGLDSWFSDRDRTVVVDDLVAADAGSYAALVAHLLSLDLVQRLRFASRPADDVLPWLLEDHRAAQVTQVRDETWLRIVDVQKALAGRRYAADGEVVLAIDDPLLPENTRRLRISRDGAEPTGQEPDITAGIAAVSAAYLGGTRWWQLVRSGRVASRKLSAIKRLDALFATPLAPHSGIMF